MKKIFVTEEVNTSRQIEFDIAKTLSIIIMVFVHCFENLSQFSDHLDTQPLYYAVVVVLDVLFAANLFIGSMGLGMVYSRNQEPDTFIKRGFRLFCSGYLLNVLRCTIPYSLLGCLGLMSWKVVLLSTFFDDILQYAGLAFILLGLLRKMKYSDWTIFFISLGMSIIGTIIRGVNFGNTLVNQLAGLFIGTYDDLFGVETSCFPLMNWFIIVVINYMFAKKLRHCANPDRFFGVALPISGVIVGVYMAYAIPNRLGMMSDDLTNYYLLTTPNVLILFPAMIFAISLYHFATKLISEKLKAGIIKISNSLTPIYYAQWIIILGIICTAATILNFKDIGTGTVVIIAVLVSVVSIMLGVRCPKKIKKIIS